jgi:hypothetical protein
MTFRSETTLVSRDDGKLCFWKPTVVFCGKRKDLGCGITQFFFLGDFIWTEASWNQDIKKRQQKTSRSDLKMTFYCPKYLYFVCERMPHSSVWAFLVTGGDRFLQVKIAKRKKKHPIFFYGLGQNAW